MNYVKLKKLKKLKINIWINKQKKKLLNQLRKLDLFQKKRKQEDKKDFSEDEIELITQTIKEKFIDELKKLK